MTKTARDVITRAMRMLGVTGVSDVATGDEYSDAIAVMQSQLDELVSMHGATIAWTVDTVPDALLEPMAMLLASDLAPTYSVQGPSRPRALMRVRAYLFTDDREDVRDIDDDGVISDTEADAGARAEYY